MQAKEMLRWTSTGVSLAAFAVAASAQTTRDRQPSGPTMPSGPRMNVPPPTMPSGPRMNVPPPTMPSGPNMGSVSAPRMPGTLGPMTTVVPYPSPIFPGTPRVVQLPGPGTNQGYPNPNCLPPAPWQPVAPGTVYVQPGGTAAVYPNYPSVVLDTAPGVQVLSSDPVAYARRPGGQIVHVQTPYGSSTTYFAGYCGAYVPGQTVVSPFGAAYGCNPYIARTYVITTGVPYLTQYEAQAQTVTAAPAYNDEPTQGDIDRSRALRAALNDLTRYWENGDASALRRRVAPDLSVAVFERDKFAYALRRADFLSLAADAREAVTTRAFRFVSSNERGDGLVSATARHTYTVRGESSARVAEVRCTLVYVDGDWFLTGIALAADALPSGGTR